MFETILNYEDLSKEFLKLKTPEDMYGFFLKSDSGISKEEFDDFIFIALESYEKISHKEVSCEELKKIAGGNLGVKVSSGVLSLITLIPYSGSFSAKDPATTETASGIVVNTQSKIQDANYYVAQAEKNGFIRIANRQSKAAAEAARKAEEDLALEEEVDAQVRDEQEERERLEQERAREQEETERRRKQEEERQVEEVEQDIEEENKYLTESAEDAMEAEAELHHREAVQEQEENAVLNQALDEYEAQQVA